MQRGKNQDGLAKPRLQFAIIPNEGVTDRNPSACLQRKLGQNPLYLSNGARWEMSYYYYSHIGKHIRAFTGTETDDLE